MSSKSGKGDGALLIAVLRWTVLVLACAIAPVSALSAIESNEWWIRIWDFPRVQILALAGVTAVGALAVRHRRRWPILGALALSGLWQAYRIFPYTPLAAPEVALLGGSAAADPSCFTAMTLNVYQKNRDFARTAALIARENPDILLLLETDARWAAALKPQLRSYDAVTGRAIGNTYGMILATRLRVRTSSVEVLPEPHTPSIFAMLETRGGAPFQFVALHPRPPTPGQDTEERDAEIAIAARRAVRTPGPALTMGDFNDVAWSHTSQLFKRIGGYLDPRVGRGPYATFPAGYPLLRWPLDHVFVTPDFVVRSVRVLGDVGSDHLPVAVEACLAPAAGRRVNGVAEAPDAEDRQDTREILQDYRKDTREDARTGE